MTMFRCLYFLLMLFLLWGCAPGDTTELPERRPGGTIMGSVVDAPIINAQVRIYRFENGIRGIRLGSTRTDGSGAYSLDVHHPSQPILVEVSGGSYVEEASGTLVTLEEGQVLRAVGKYQSGQTHNLMVTPLTHMATALAEYKISNGMSAERAITEATSTINQFFALDNGTTKPIDITDENNEISEFGDQVLYGFYLAGLSDWSLWASKQNQVDQPHKIYTTIALNQVIYHDLRSDGLLNGIGLNQYVNDLERLGFGVVPLNEDAYRLAFSLHMLAIANSSKNKTSFTGNDLLDAAHRIAGQTTMLVGATDPIDIDNQQPTLSIDKPTGLIYCGLFTFQVNVDSLLGAESITMSISSGGQVKNEEEFLLDDPRSLQISVDTADYIDGEYQFDLSAVDMLGNRASTTFVVQFDKTSPVINVTSPSATNQSIALITGTYNNCNVTNIQAIYVGGEQATLLTDGTWNVSVALEKGENIIPISAIDQAGSQIYATETALYLDDIAPVIDSTDKHSQVRFSNGDGTYTQGTLQDINNTVPLYFETDNVELGSVPINREALDSNTIPYFAFSVSDQMGPGVVTESQDIQVRMRYQQNDQVLNPWHNLVLVGDEFLIPLASETLSSDWRQSTPLDEHLIQVEVTDIVGNQTIRSFSFYAEFYVPVFTVASENISDLGADIFSMTDFADRVNLNGMEFASTAYTFTNPTGNTFYIRLSDDSVHTTIQTVEQLVREHLVNTKATTEWRLGLMTPNVTSQCPDFDIISGAWVYPTSVFNWTGSDWVKEQVPGPTYGTSEAIFSDTLPASPTPSDWVDVPDFDQEFMTATIDFSSVVTLTYGYDYVLNQSSDPSAGYVFDWKYKVLFGEIIIICPPKRYFHQQEVYVYESVNGYPMPVLSTIEITNTPDFSTTSYKVMDNDTGSNVESVNGWYKIPVGHSITIQKWVTTPDIILYSDDISDVNNFPSYIPNLHDKTISWSVARNLSMSMANNPGEGNLESMPIRVITIGEGVMAYQIAR